MNEQFPEPPLSPSPNPVLLRSDLPPLPHLTCSNCRSVIIENLNTNLKEWGPTNPPSEQQAIHTRPNNSTDPLYERVLKIKLRRLEKDSALGRRIQKYLHSGKNSLRVPISLEDYMMAAVHCPKLGLETLSKILSLVSAGILSTLGVSTDEFPSLASLTPPPATLNKLVIGLGTDTVLLISNDITDKKSSLICDRGESKTAHASFVKSNCFNTVKTVLVFHSIIVQPMQEAAGQTSLLSEKSNQSSVQPLISITTGSIPSCTH